MTEQSSQSLTASHRKDSISTVGSVPHRFVPTTKIEFTTCSVSSGITAADNKPTSAPITWTSRSGALGWDESGPISVEGTADYHPKGWYETPDRTVMKYKYANGVIMKLSDKHPARRARSRELSSFARRVRCLFGAEASLQVHRICSSQLLFPNRWSRTAIWLRCRQEHKRYANIAHVQDFIDCVKSRKTPSADISIGHRSATVCHLGNIAVRTGKKINWNPESETIVGDADAAKWLMKKYRAPYTLA